MAELVGSAFMPTSAEDVHAVGGPMTGLVKGRGWYASQQFYWGPSWFPVSEMFRHGLLRFRR